jgi:hypothetical protein
MDRELIAELAEKEFNCRMRLEGMRMMNTAGLDYEDRKKQAIEYAIAEAEHNKCRAELYQAQIYSTRVYRTQIYSTRVYRTQIYSTRVYRTQIL